MQLGQRNLGLGGTRVQTQYLLIRGDRRVRLPPQRLNPSQIEEGRGRVRMTFGRDRRAFEECLRTATDFVTQTLLPVQALLVSRRGALVVA